MKTCPNCFSKHSDDVISCDCGYRLGDKVVSLQNFDKSIFPSTDNSVSRDAKNSIVLFFFSFFSFLGSFFIGNFYFLVLAIFLFLLSIFSFYRKYLNDPQNKIWKIASIKKNKDIRIANTLIKCFCDFEIEKSKIQTISSQNEAIMSLNKRIFSKVDSIFKKFSRILIREAHLISKINQFESIENLKSRLNNLEEKIKNTFDSVSKGHLIRTADLLKDQIACINDLITFTKRCETQRIQVIEECRSIFIKIGAIEFADLKVSTSMAEDLENTLDSVESEIQALETATTKVLIGSTIS
jgi:hypothetical protein